MADWIDAIRQNDEDVKATARAQEEALRNANLFFTERIQEFWRKLAEALTADARELGQGFPNHVARQFKVSDNPSQMMIGITGDGWPQKILAIRFVPDGNRAVEVGESSRQRYENLTQVKPEITNGQFIAVGTPPVMHLSYRGKQFHEAGEFSKFLLQKLIS